MASSLRATTSAVHASPSNPVYASLQLRVIAFILDILVLISFGMLFAAATGAYLVVDSRFNDGNLSGRAEFVAVGVILAYFLAFLPLYHVLMWSWGGQTVGKMAVRIRVMSRRGGKVPLRRSALRLLGYVASAVPIFLGVLLALVDSERRTLHDRLADTVVVELP